MNTPGKSKSSNAEKLRSVYCLYRRQFENARQVRPSQYGFAEVSFDKPLAKFGGESTWDRACLVIDESGLDIISAVDALFYVAEQRNMLTPPSASLLTDPEMIEAFQPILKDRIDEMRLRLVSQNREFENHCRLYCMNPYSAIVDPCCNVSDLYRLCVLVKSGWQVPEKIRSNAFDQFYAQPGIYSSAWGNFLPGRLTADFDVPMQG